MLKQLFIIYALSFSSILFSQELSLKVTGVSGLSFIENTEINKYLRVFRGSEIHKEYRLKIQSNSQVEITINRQGDKVGTIKCLENTTLLVNPSIYKKEDYRLSLSLLGGYIEVSIDKNIESIVEIHTANTSSIVKGTQFEVAFAEDGSSIVLLKEGLIDIFTDDEERILNPKEAYINNIEKNSKVVKQDSDNNTIVFLNRCEESSRENYFLTIENLMQAMENISYNNDLLPIPIENLNVNEETIKNMEMKMYRMLAANEGYYNSIVKLIDSYPQEKNEMITYGRKSYSLYYANQRALAKMNSSIMKTREKFDKIKRKFDERVYK